MAQYYMNVSIEWSGIIEADNLIDARGIAMEIAERNGIWSVDGERIDEEDED